MKNIMMAIALFMGLISVKQTFAQTFEHVRTYSFDTGPEEISSYQLICYDNFGEYLVYYNFAQKRVNAFAISDGIVSNFNQTIKASFSSEKNLILFTTRHIFAAHENENLNMTLNLKGKPYLNIFSEETQKSYRLKCKTNDL